MHDANELVDANVLVESMKFVLLLDFITPYEGFHTNGNKIDIIFVALRIVKFRNTNFQISRDKKNWELANCHFWQNAIYSRM